MKDHVIMTAALAFLFGMAGCGKSSDNTVAVGNGVQVSGFLAAAQTVHAVGSAQSALETEQLVDQVMAIPMDRGSLSAWNMQNRLSSAVGQDGSFSLELDTSYDWLLVLIDSTQSDETRYVGSLSVSTSATDGLLNLPLSEAVVDQLDVGIVSVTANGDASSSDGVEAADFDMTADQITALAKIDNLFKNAKNMVNNYGAFGNGDGIWYQLRPDFSWDGSTSSIANDFSDPNEFIYRGMGFQLDGNPHSVTMDQLCDRQVVVTLTPPDDVTISDAVYGPDAPLTSDQMECQPLQVEGHDPALEGWSGPLYASGAYEDISYSVASGIMSNPAGYWTWRQDGVVKAMFDVSGVNPPVTSDDKAKGFVPSYRLNLGGDNLIQSVDIEWYYYDESSLQYVKLTPADLPILEHFVRGTEVKFDNTTGATRRTEEIYVDPETTNVVPENEWYFGSHPEDTTRETGLMGFYESGGFGYFFNFFMAP